MAGNASRRRPSMDWPLSREEKKVCAMQLYEKDVQACEDLLESKDRALVAAKEEIKVLRRASTASTRTSVGRSSAGDSPDASTASTRTSVGGPACDIDVSVSDSSAAQTPTKRLPSPPRGREAAPAHAASPRRNPAMQRSSSLEAVTSFLPGWKTSEQEGSAANAQGQGRDTVSPRRGHGSMRRSSSLETASSFWGGAWKAVRTGAKAASHTAKETARILADETRLLVDEAKMVFEAPVSNEANSGTTTDATISPTDRTVARTPETEFIEWHIDCTDLSVDPGLRLEPAIQGEPRRVSAVMQGLAIANWNNESMPVTVYLYPGRREAVMRRIAVCATDELSAVDDEPMLAALEDESVGKCNKLTFRRRRKQRAPPPFNEPVIVTIYGQ